MIPRLESLRALLRPVLQSINHRKASNNSDSTPLSASTNVCGTPKADLTRCLMNQGLPLEASEEIVSQLPNVRFDQDEIHRTLDTLTSLQFGQDRLVELLKTNPSLIFVSSNQINKCYSNLSSILTQNYVYKVLFNSPSVVEQKRSQIAEKLNYINKELGIPNSYVVNSSALSHPIAHLKVRSEFLKRCGILKISTKKDQVMTVVNLNDMFEATDEQFATKVAKLTVIEYEAFLNLFSFEGEYDSDQESDSDSD